MGLMKLLWMDGKREKTDPIPLRDALATFRCPRCSDGLLTSPPRCCRCPRGRARARALASAHSHVRQAALFKPTPAPRQGACARLADLLHTPP